jgi:prolyl-tRNA synthetase
MLRAGFIKPVANGIWSLAAPAKRIALKVEAIIRDEMNKINGQEVTFPVVMPRELWDESGRYSSIGDEMARFKDRSQRDLVLGMTHEEAAVHLARDFVSSYQQLPCMVYQIQTKFRDEARPRGGLIRVREFTMKDAYSFHNSLECLDDYYDKAFKAYERIFKRIGLKNFVAVESDSGMMGGNISHEFMLLTDVGEDTIILCNCGYKANMEVAESKAETFRDEISQPMQEVFTGDAKEIADVCAFLKIPSYKTAKAVCFNVKNENQRVLCFVRGDLEINEAKLKKVIKKDIAPVSLQDGAELVAGNIGAIGLNLTNTIIVYDASLKNENNMVVGANKVNFHITGADFKRDVKAEYHDIAKVKEGAKCVHCGNALAISGGIEIGNIFKLGTKYTSAMGMTVLNAEGAAVNPIMGCYGIGVGRAIASAAEELADEKGLNWPMSIAPWHVYLCPLRVDTPEVKQAADRLYAELTNAGVEVLYDDRDCSAGFKFSDCDLMGIPLRLVVSPRSLAENNVEIAFRASGEKINVGLSECVEYLLNKLSNK